MEWMKDKPKFKSMVNNAESKYLNRNLTERNKKSIDILNKNTVLKGSGYVYLLRCENTNFYKIGVSKIHFKTRLSGIQSGCPFLIIPIYVEYAKEYFRVEKYLHKKYKKKNIRGEWFEFNEKEVEDVINELKTKAQTQIELNFKYN